MLTEVLWVQVSMNELMISAGFLLANFVGWCFSTTTHGWRYMFGFASVIAGLQLVSRHYCCSQTRGQCACVCGGGW